MALSCCQLNQVWVFFGIWGLANVPPGMKTSGCELVAATCQHPRAARCVSATWLQLLQHSSRKNNQKRNNIKKKKIEAP